MLIYLIVNQNTITKSQHAQFMLNTSTPKSGRYNKKETKQMMAHLNLDGMGQSYSHRDGSYICALILVWSRDED